MNTNDFPLSRGARAARAALLALAAASVLPACAPVLVGSAMVGGALASVDRRTAGTQVEDQAIELKGAARVRELAGEQAHVNVTSYNRIVLLTGEVPDAAARGAVEQAIGRIEGVRSVVNELAVMGKTTLTARSNDAVLSARVKAGFIDAKDLQVNTIKVTTERGVVHLMGRVTEREATRAVAVARSVPGVQKVVRVFEILTDAQLAELLNSSGQQPRK
ncbi:MAG: BON domain-containing protein [Rubrivivax sp.]|jgi:osmotically-inducible protein OsmY|nr:BON domain-containing protein [Rubrivivax sp.]